MITPARQSIVRLAAAVSVIALAACSPQADKAAKPVTLVEVVTVQPQQHASSQVLTGAVQPRAQTPAAFLVSGRLTAAGLSVGDRVAKGDVIATLSSVEQEADLEAADAGVAAAQSRLAQVTSSLDRQKTLWDQGLTTRSALDGAQTAYDTAVSAAESAEAQRNLALEALGYTKLVATADGVIIRKMAEVDEVVQAGSPVYVIAEDGPRNVVINVQETAIGDWQAGNTISVTPIAANARTIEGTVSEIAPALDATGTVQVKVAINDQLPLGSSVSVTLNKDGADRILLPAQALTQSRGEPTVWVVSADNSVHQTPVTVELFETGTVVVTDGLEAGDKVVASGTHFLTPGQVVETREIAAK